MNDFINPEWIWENFDRRTKGCFSCAHSKREALKGVVQSFCKPEEDGMIVVDYPHEDETTCEMYWPKRRG